MYFKIIPFILRWAVLSLIMTISLLVVFVQSWTLDQLGLAIPLSWANISPYLLFTAIGVISILIVSISKHKKSSTAWWKHPRIYFFSLSSIFQEFLFRVFLIELLLSISLSPALVVLISATLFTGMHIIFSVKSYELFLLFTWGLALGFLYVLIPSFILVAIVHMIFNFLTVIYEKSFTLPSNRKNFLNDFKTD